MTLFAFHAVQQDSNMSIVLLLWLVASPLPFLLGIQEPLSKNKFCKIPIYGPFDHSKLESAMSKFFHLYAKVLLSILLFLTQRIFTEIVLMDTE